MWGANEPWYANNAFHTSESTYHTSSEVSDDSLLSRAKPKTVTANTGQLQGDVVKIIFDDPDNLNTPYDGFRDPWEGSALNHNRLFKTTNRVDNWIPVKESMNPVGPIVSAKARMVRSNACIGVITRRVHRTKSYVWIGSKLRQEPPHTQALGVCWEQER